MPTLVETQDPSVTTLIDLAGGTNPVYVAVAKSVQPTFTFTVTSVSKAVAAVVTITAHGLNTDNLVMVSGATGDWAAMNGKQIITRTGANTFTVAVDSTGFAGSFDGVITSTAPRMAAGIWKISKNYYDGSNNLLRSSVAAGGALNQIYDNRASIEYN